MRGDTAIRSIRRTPPQAYMVLLHFIMVSVIKKIGFTFGEVGRAIPLEGIFVARWVGS